MLYGFVRLVGSYDLFIFFVNLLVVTSYLSEIAFVFEEFYQSNTIEIKKVFSIVFIFINDFFIASLL